MYPVRTGTGELRGLYPPRQLGPEAMLRSRRPTALGVTHVLTLAPELKLSLPASFTHESIVIADTEDADIAAVFQKAVAFIDRCHAGEEFAHHQGEFARHRGEFTPVTGVNGRVPMVNSPATGSRRNLPGPLGTGGLWALHPPRQLGPEAPPPNIGHLGGCAEGARCWCTASRAGAGAQYWSQFELNIGYLGGCAEGGAVLVHCFEGQSRSPISGRSRSATVVVAHFMMKQGWDVAKAFKHVAAKHPVRCRAQTRPRWKRHDK
eukprot:1177564-Prorocentrum_minimum.AAC.9